MKSKKAFIFTLLYTLVLHCVVHFVLPVIIPGLFTDGVSSFTPDVGKFHNLACNGESNITLSGNVVIFVIKIFYDLFGICNVALSGYLGVMLISIAGYLIIDTFSVYLKKKVLLSYLLIISLPSVINWYLFLNKESFIFLGLCFIYNFLFFTRNRNIAYDLFFIMIGVTIILVTKFYYSYYLLFISLTILIISLIKKDRTLLKKSLVSLVTILITANFAKNVGVFDRASVVSNQKNSVNLVYEKSNFNKLFSMPLYARSYYLSRQKGDSDVDRDLFFKRYRDLFAYIPRLTYLSFFYPSPKDYSFSSLRSIMISIQSLIIGTAVIFSVLALFRNIYLLPLFIVIEVICFSVPNVGSYYRYRDPFLIFILTYGLCNLQNFIEKYRLTLCQIKR
ncbi:hypothetical protein BALOs_0028 [Halobacteriovorax sp. BALOs_7]|nr:hypothetical protein BALOs_0028 [Halobacteriovorax sp. BALOs_7]